MNLRNGAGDTPLICIVRDLRSHSHQIDFVLKILRRKEIHLNARDKRGITALMYACLLGKVHVVQMLLDAGSDPCLGKKVDNETFTPLHCAEFAKHEKIVNILKAHGTYFLEFFVAQLTALGAISRTRSTPAIAVCLNNL